MPLFKTIAPALLLLVLSWGLPNDGRASSFGSALGLRLGSGHPGIYFRFGHDYHHHDRYHYGGYKYRYYGYKRYHKERLAYGWHLLTEDRPGRAIQVFGEVADAYPSKGEPKVGFAIAAAEAGRLSKGIWAMRRALQYDPAALYEVSLNHALRSIVKDLIGRYKYSDGYGLREKDTYFMAAAFHYLLGEWEASEAAANRVLYLKDYSVSAKNLQHLIKSR